MKMLIRILWLVLCIGCTGCVYAQTMLTGHAMQADTLGSSRRESDTTVSPASKKSSAEDASSQQSETLADALRRYMEGRRKEAFAQGMQGSDIDSFVKNDPIVQHLMRQLENAQAVTGVPSSLVSTSQTRDDVFANANVLQGMLDEVSALASKEEANFLDWSRRGLTSEMFFWLTNKVFQDGAASLMGNLARLQVLDLSHNELDRTIAPSLLKWLQLPELQFVMLNKNKAMPPRCIGELFETIQSILCKEDGADPDIADKSSKKETTRALMSKVIVASQSYSYQRAQDNAKDNPEENLVDMYGYAWWDEHVKFYRGEVYKLYQAFQLAQLKKKLLKIDIRTPTADALRKELENYDIFRIVILDASGNDWSANDLALLTQQFFKDGKQSDPVNLAALCYVDCSDNMIGPGLCDVVLPWLCLDGLENFNLLECAVSIFSVEELARALHKLDSARALARLSKLMFMSPAQLERIERGGDSEYKKLVQQGIFPDDWCKRHRNFLESSRFVNHERYKETVRLGRMYSPEEISMLMAFRMLEPMKFGISATGASN